MKHVKKNLSYILIVLLILSSIFIWYLVFNKKIETDYLTVAFLDVGQGDAIYIEAPNGKQMLVDAGPSGVVLQRLAEVMPYGDRSIDIVLATHSDMDHIGGFPFVFNNYKVSDIIENGVVVNTDIYKNLDKEISKNKVREIIARRGMRIILDKKRNIYFDILFPDQDVSDFEFNDGSIVGRLVYGAESFMLTGDATTYTENLIKWNEVANSLKSQVLKLGHHGSKTSSSFLWLEEVDPNLVIISAGKYNKYGHPHQEILDRLKKLNIPYLATYEKGNIIFKTDGMELIKQ